jgi:hypothetical protein
VGDTITISGVNLAPGGSSLGDVVTFGGAPSTFIHAVDADNITVVVPFDATSGPITVTTPLGTATSARSFIVVTTLPPEIASFSALSGPVGFEFFISGTNLDPAANVGQHVVVLYTSADGATCQDFNSSFDVSESRIATVVPACAQTGPITVKTFAGSNTSAQSFTVIPTPPPVIAEFSPSVAQVGAVITITGTNLYVPGDDNNLVQFTTSDSTPCIYQEGVFDPTRPAIQLTAPIPACAQTGPITVITYAGSAISAQVLTVT